MRTSVLYFLMCLVISYFANICQTVMTTLCSLLSTHIHIEHVGSDWYSGFEAEASGFNMHIRVKDYFIMIKNKYNKVGSWT